MLRVRVILFFIMHNFFLLFFGVLQKILRMSETFLLKLKCFVINYCVNEKFSEREVRSENFLKTNISYKYVIHRSTCAYQRVRNFNFPKNFANLLNAWSQRCLVESWSSKSHRSIWRDDKWFFVSQLLTL